MKTPVRIHLLDTETPHRNGADVLALCGAVVPQSSADFRNDWSDGHCHDLLDIRGLCVKCLRATGDPSGKRYTYGLVPGEVAIRHQAEVFGG